MSTVVVCLRSRLASEAVALLVAGTSEFDTEVAEPEGAVRCASVTPELLGVLVDPQTAAAVGDLECPVVVLGRRASDAAGLAGVVVGLAPDIDGDGLRRALIALADGSLPSWERPASPVPHRRRATDGPEILTAREREVLEMVAAAASPQDIASALDVSEHTVRTHVQNLMAKLGATSKVDAVARGRSLGLLEVGRHR